MDATTTKKRKAFYIYALLLIVQTLTHFLTPHLLAPLSVLYASGGGGGGGPSVTY